TLSFVTPIVTGAVFASAGLLPGLPEGGPARPLPVVAAFLAGAVVATMGHRLGSRRVAAACLLVLAFVAWRESDQVRPLLAVRASVNSTDRADAWRAALREASRRPLFGTGGGRAAYAYRSAAGR